MKTTLSKEQVILKAVTAAKNSQFGATAIKVELEAQLHRPGRDENEYCHTCNHGEVRCDNEHENTSRGVIISCGDGCQRGRRVCPECDGNWVTYLAEENWGNEWNCQDFILEQLVEYGLARKLRRGEYSQGSYKYKAKLPLVFNRFYNDGSVDSEYTFTLSLDDPKNILLLPKIVQAFNDLADKVGNGIDTQGAGMHMAFINDPDGSYPTTCSQMTEFLNFRRSMQLVIPALFFLGSSNNVSRMLHFRQPRIRCEGDDSEDYDDEPKYSAIFYTGGALEFRVFETCYHNPELILDNFVVMANSLKFWSERYVENRLRNIAETVTFGNDKDLSINRFYTSVQHIDLLNAGLLQLKPAYYTTREVKKQRQFKTTKRTLGKQFREEEKAAALSYREYEDRFNWSLIVEEQDLRTRLLQNYTRNHSTLPSTNTERRDAVNKIEAEVKRRLAEQGQNKQTVTRYIKERLDRFQSEQQGDYTLGNI